MTIEEKAKAYDEAIGRAKAVLNDGTISSCNLAYLQDIFPELEELKNEIIRKHLIAFFKNTCSKESYARFAGIKIAEIVAWLEKQGNPININSSEFDLRLNKLPKQFKTLPKEELANSLSFYLNVVQNKGEQNPTEWNEEDKKMFVNIKACLRNTNKDYSRELNWLKSLKPQKQK